MRRSLIQYLSKPGPWFFAYVCWFVILYVLSEQTSVGPQVKTFNGIDKVAHAIYFASGATALGIGLLIRSRGGISRGLLLAILLGLSLSVGIFDEWHQSTTPGRDGNSIGDIIADVVGGGIGFFLSVSMFGFAARKGLLTRSVA